MFTNKFFAVPQEEKESKDNPSSAFTSLLASVNSHEQIGSFLAIQANRVALYERVAKMVSQFKIWAASVWGSENDVETLKTFNADLDCFLNKFQYNGNNDATNQTILAPYKEGLPIFATILGMLNSKQRFPTLDIKKAVMINLVNDINVCFPGIHTKAAYAFMQLSYDLEGYIMRLRQEHVKGEVLKQIKLRPVLQANNHMHVHYVNSVCNAVATYFGLKKIKDYYEINLSLPEQGRDARQKQIAGLLREIVEIVCSMQTINKPESVWDLFFNSVKTEILHIDKTQKNWSDKIEHVETFLVNIGIDPFFSFYSLYDENSFQLKNEAMFDANLRITLLARLVPKGYFDLSEVQKITVDKKQIHLFRKRLDYSYVVIPEDKESKPFSIIDEIASGSFAVNNHLKTVVTSADLLSLFSSASDFICSDAMAGKISYFLEMLTELSDQVSFINRSLKPDKETILHATAKANNAIATEAILNILTPQHKCRLLNGVNANGETAMHYAAINNSVDAALMILNQVEKKEKYKYLRAETKDNEYNPLHIAAEKGHEKFVELIANAVNVRSLYLYMKLTAKEDMTALHVAVLNGRDAIINKLFYLIRNDTKKIKEYVSKVKKNNENVLHLVAKSNHVNCLPSLVNAMTQANVLSELLIAGDEFNRTPLYLAASLGHVEGIKAFLELQAESLRFDYVAKGDMTNVTPLHAAVLSDKPQGIKTLLSFIPDEKQQIACILQQNKMDHDALDEAVLKDNDGAFVALLEGISEGRRADLFTYPGNHGITKLHQAAAKNSVKVLTYMLRVLFEENKIDALFARTEQGETPLHVAAKQNNMIVVQMLVSAVPMMNRKAYVTDINLKLQTPLDLALQGSLSEYVIPILVNALPTVEDKINYILRSKVDWPMFVATSKKTHDAAYTLLNIVPRQLWTTDQRYHMTAFLKNVSDLLLIPDEDMRLFTACHEIAAMKVSQRYEPSLSSLAIVAELAWINDSAFFQPYEKVNEHAQQFKRFLALKDQLFDGLLSYRKEKQYSAEIAESFKNQIQAELRLFNRDVTTLPKRIKMLEHYGQSFKVSITNAYYEKHGFAKFLSRLGMFKAVASVTDQIDEVLEHKTKKLKLG